MDTSGPAASPAPLTPAERGWAVAIAVVGAFSLFWRIGASQVLSDEVVYLRAGAALLSGEGDPNPEHPPLAKLLYGVGGELVGDPLLGGRIVAALAAFGVGALLFWLVRRIAGNRAGLLAASLWLALPVGGGSTGPLAQAGRLDRFAMLEPIVAVLVVAALAVGWSWLQRPRWQAAAMTGVLGGLAAAAKPTGVLVLPAIAVVVLWTRRAEFPRPATGVAIAVLGSLVGLGLGFAVLGAQALDQLRFLVEFQGGRLDDGHVVTVAGTTSAFPPWWSHLWFHLRDDGPVLTGVLFGGVVTAPFAVRGRGEAAIRGVALLLSAFGVLFVALAASPVKLNFYRYAWWPLLVALLAITLDAAERERSTRERPGPSWFIAVGAVLVLSWTSVAHLGRVATLRPGGYQLVATEVVNTSGFVNEPYEPMLIRGRTTILDFYVEPWALRPIERTDDLALASAVLLDPEITSRFPRPEVEAVLDDPAWTCRPFAELVLCLRSPA